MSTVFFGALLRPALRVVVAVLAGYRQRRLGLVRIDAVKLLEFSIDLFDTQRFVVVGLQAKVRVDVLALAPILWPATFEPPGGGLPMVFHGLHDVTHHDELGLAFRLLYGCRKIRKFLLPAVER